MLLPPFFLPIIAAAAFVASQRVGVRAAITLGLLAMVGTASAALNGPPPLDGFDGVASSTLTLEVRLLGDPVAAYGHLASVRVIRSDDPAVAGRDLLAGPLPPDALAGDTLVARGVVRAGVRRLRVRTFGATARIGEVIEHRPSTNPMFVVGNTIRRRVADAFNGDTAASGLLRGFLIGDTSDVPPKHVEDLRRSGLTHFVAVSGSNVALFLAAWWLVTLPISIHPRLRSLIGLVGLAVFVVVTRWEPSVVRASVMAGTVLVGGLIGIPVDPWMALGVSVAGILLVAPSLITSVGFLLSVFATTGVMVGVAAADGLRPRWIAMPLGATLGAQVAVAPILLIVFRSIPLLAPIANVFAAPVVAVTTAIGLGAVATPIPFLGSVAERGASMVLWIADRASVGPQLGVVAVLFVTLLAAVLLFRPVRPVAVAAIVVTLIGAAARAPRWPTVPTAVVLDIGQGDSILLQDPSGAAVLVDGGPSGTVTDRALRRHGVSHLDIVVMTHGDADHVGGLIDVVRSRRVGEVWVPEYAVLGPLGEELVAVAAERGVPVVRVHEGKVVAVGSIVIRVLSPGRRFRSDNDGCIVLTATARASLLLPCDAEAIAQRELPPIHVDAMVVPHHGSATTDLEWLERTLSRIAVLSYGENSYGHPNPAVLEVLDTADVNLHQTYLEGDVVVPLGAASDSPS